MVLKVEKIDPEVEKRWSSYRDINEGMKEVRVNELRRTLEITNAKPGERILEIGSGSGYLTIPLARRLGASGTLTTSDINPRSLEEIELKNTEGLPISTYAFDEIHDGEPKFSKIEEESLDAAVSLATFHHFDNRSIGSGNLGRTRILEEIFTKLKSGGRLIIGDICHGTSTQRYFDALDNPNVHFHPLGHPHDFFTLDQMRDVLQNIGYSVGHLKVEEVPWQFKDETEAGRFLNRIFNSTCSEEESFRLAQNYQGTRREGKGIELGWNLMFLRADK